MSHLSSFHQRSSKLDSRCLLCSYGLNTRCFNLLLSLPDQWMWTAVHQEGFLGFRSSAAEVFVLWDDAAYHPRQMETQLHITLLLQIKFRFTRPTPKLWLYNQCTSFNSGYYWPPEWGHAETLCKKAVSVHEHRTWNSYKRRGFGNCLKQRMVVSCHTGCVWDRATTTFKFLMDQASGTVHLFIEVTNIYSLINDKHVQFAKRDYLE